MKIPRKITLAGIPIDIIDTPGLAKDRKLLAEARYNEQKIIIDMAAAAKNIIEQSLCHEIVHWVLYIMNEDEHRNNERFVDLMGHFVYQALQTAEYADESDLL